MKEESLLSNRKRHSTELIKKNFYNQVWKISTVTMASPQPIWHFLKHHDVKIDTGSYGKAGLEFIPLNNQIDKKDILSFLYIFLRCIMNRMKSFIGQ